MNGSVGVDSRGKVELYSVLPDLGLGGARLCRRFEGDDVGLSHVRFWGGLSKADLKLQGKFEAGFTRLT